VGSDKRLILDGGNLIVSIHAPRVGSDEEEKEAILDLCVSIHAPRVGSDIVVIDNAFHVIFVSIHAPRVGSDS